MMIRGLNICFRLSIRPEVEKTILFGATSVAAGLSFLVISLYNFSNVKVCVFLSTQGRRHIFPGKWGLTLFACLRKQIANSSLRNVACDGSVAVHQSW
jgi:hypothetical protein